MSSTPWRRPPRISSRSSKVCEIPREQRAIDVGQGQLALRPYDELPSLSSVVCLLMCFLTEQLVNQASRRLTHRFIAVPPDERLFIYMMTHTLSHHQTDTHVVSASYTLQYGTLRYAASLISRPRRVRRPTLPTGAALPGRSAPVERLEERPPGTDHRPVP